MVSNSYQFEHKRVRKPADVFRACPSCISPNLLRLEGEAFCTHCQWNSIRAHEEAKDIKQMKAQTKGGRA